MSETASRQEQLEDLVDELMVDVETLRFLLDTRPGPNNSLRLWLGWSEKVTRELRKLEDAAG